MQILQTSTYFWLGKLDEQKEIDEYITTLDPLGVDKEIKLIPQLNQNRDVKKIISMLYQKIPFPDRLNAFNYGEALACMRDLGIFIGSIKRHGVEPVDAVPELDYILDVLSIKTDLPPRDTLNHYSLWNPLTTRVRTYTFYRDEVELISSVKMAMNPLMKGIYYLMELYNTPLHEPSFESLCEKVGEQYKLIIEAIVSAKRNVSPQIFAKELRLYFDPIKLHGKEFIGPGAVEMPLFVFDHILWGSDVEHEKYREFSQTYVPFNLPSVRDIYFNFSDQPSLLSKAVKALDKEKILPQTLESARALYNLCKLEKSFRIPHKKLAEESYNYEPEAQRGQGSGGYSTSILTDIIDVNNQQLDRLVNSIVVHS